LIKFSSKSSEKVKSNKVHSFSEMSFELTSVWKALADAAGSGSKGDISRDASQLLAVADDHAFVWSAKDVSLVAAYLSSLSDQVEHGRLQYLRLTETPLFEVIDLRSNYSLYAVKRVKRVL